MDIQINNNIDDVKPKVLGPFTGMQLICVTIAIIIEAAGVYLIQSIFPNSIIRYILPLPLVIIPLVLGWAEEFLHMPLKDYWELVFKRKYTHPAFRPYKYHNYLETLEAQAFKEIAQEKAEAEKKQNKEEKKKKVKEPPVKIPPELTRYE